MTQTQFQPLGDRILILPEVIEEKTRGGIIIPEKAKERPVRGTVVKVGPGRWSEDMKAHVPPSVDPGDEVMYSQFAGTDITPTKIRGSITWSWPSRCPAWMPTSRTRHLPA
jgi:chaperonin GroES